MDIGRTSRYLATLMAAAVVAASLTATARAADNNKAAGPDPQTFEKVVTQAVEYLRTKGQAEDGSYSKQTGPAVTALVTAAVLRNGRSTSDPMVANSLKFLETFVQPDGGIYAKESTHTNYETCLSILAFSEANKSGKYDKLLANAEKYVKGLQWDGSEGHDESSPNFGGAGYGGHKRPDLSNTQFLLDALKATGNGPDDEAVKKALIFVSRCQNLETEANTTPFAAKVNDGGFYYTPAAGGTSQSGETENGGLRSYASMTYAGLKSMIFAGVDADDPRVKAAFEWCQKHYDLDSNPGMGENGLLYYYNTFAKALGTMGVETITDAEGKQHDWRRELVEELASRQQPDGSFVNDTKRWLEGDPNLVTGYALMALSYCRPQEKTAAK